MLVLVFFCWLLYSYSCKNPLLPIKRKVNAILHFNAAGFQESNRRWCLNTAFTELFLLHATALKVTIKKNFQFWLQLAQLENMSTERNTDWLKINLATVTLQSLKSLFPLWSSIMAFKSAKTWNYDRTLSMRSLLTQFGSCWRKASTMSFKWDPVLASSSSCSRRGK